MTKEELQTFKEMFGKFCTHEIRSGHCIGAECQRCLVNSTYDVVCHSEEDKPDERINPYVNAIAEVNKLYDVGETNLTDKDIVRVNGIECYVLRVEDSKALMITKEIYDARFNNVNIGKEKEYCYATADIKKFMDDFYVNQLGRDKHILTSDVTYYFNDEYAGGNLGKYKTGSITQNVFALDAKEAKKYVKKFVWNYTGKMDGRGYGFWVAAGYRSNSGYSGGFNVNCDGNFYSSSVDSTSIGIRPAFWLDLE